jgi:mRNA interferase RelE/StbE
VASYELLMKRSAAKELEALPPVDRKRIAHKIERLAKNPRPVGSEKLSGQPKYRLRQGDYRILYTVDDKTRQVVVVKIAHRRNAYD